MTKKKYELLEGRTVSISRDAAIASGQFVKEREYWLNKLSGELIKSYFPYDYNKTKTTDSLVVKKNSVTAGFPGDLFSGLMRLSRGHDYAMYIIAAAVAVVLLDKYTYNSKKDIIIGVPIYEQKTDADTEFVNTVLVLRIQLEEVMTFKELLFQVRQTMLEADENKNYPIEVLMSQLNMSISEYDCPLFDVAVLLENIHDIGYLHQVNLNIIFCLRRTGESMEMEVQYNASRYQRATVEGIALHFTCLLQRVLLDPALRLTDIDMVTEEERKQLIEDFNDTAVEYPRDKTIQELFEEQAEKSGGGVAVVCGGQGAGGRASHLTYGELNRKANRLAHQLIEKGVKHDTIVGLMVERSIEMIIGIMGILKAGAGYLPIDPGYPQERIDFMLKDTGAKVLVSELSEVSEVSKGIEVLGLSLLPARDAMRCSLLPASSANSSNLAYIIYTSGTTGKPKGVLTAHRNVTRVVRNTNYIDLKDNDRILQLSDYAFDGSVFDIYGALLNSAALVMMDREDWLSVERLSEVIKREAITVFFVTTALFNTMIDLDIDCLAGIRKVLFGGERVSVEHAGKALEYLGKDRIIHVYGPTETTVYATYYFVDTIDETCSTIPIGAPIANTTAYIMDRYLHPVPVRVTGEVYIGGDGVARGYLNNPELTAEKFLSVSYRSYRSHRSYISKKIYKTGDLARWLADGNIEFLGRIDHQVKIRGFRIEPGEIENVLLKKEDIKEALVLAEENKKGDKYLCAYIVLNRPPLTEKADGFDITELKEYLSGGLPDYMMPSYFIPVEKMPLTASGKVDRNALPAPGITTGETYIAPRNRVEEILVEIWAEVLEVEKDIISIDSNFFALGGHSLKAVALVSKIHRDLDVKLPLAEVFRHKDIRGLAGYIEKSGRTKYVGMEPVEEKEYYELSSAQKRLHFLQQMDVQGTAYNMPGFMILEGNLEIKSFERTFKKLIDRHESLRTSFEMIGDEPVQRVHKDVEFEVEYSNREYGAGRAGDFIRAFNLSRPPLLRVGLIKKGEQEHILMVDMHHIISDGASLGVLVNEFMTLFGERDLTLVKIQYKDFSEWQNSERKKKVIREQEEYWLNEFAGEIPVLNLPIDYERPLAQDFAGSAVSFRIGKEQMQQLKALALEEGATLFMVLISMFNILLSKLSGQEDIVVGTPIAGRGHKDLENVIGIFVNTLAMRNYPAGEKHFLEFLREVKKKILAAFDNQDYKFEDLVEKAAVNRDISRNPLFDVMFALQNIDISRLEIPGLKLAPYNQEIGISKFDMSWDCFESGEGLFFSVEYCKKLFKAETVERLIRYFKKIVTSLLENMEVMIADIEIITGEEKIQVLYEFNDTGTECQYRKGETVHRLFEDQVERTPEKIAVVSSKNKDRETVQSTYRELNRKSDQLAHLLLEKGVKPDTIVAIMMERSLEMIIGILGILKAGGAYLPIDPDYPEERKQYMLADSSARILLTNLSEGHHLHHSSFITHHSSSLAYVIYTSGTTGRPKGVAVEHRNLMAYLNSFENEFDLQPDDTVIQQASFTFDAFAEELYPILLKGGKLAVPAREVIMDMEALSKFIVKHRVTLVTCSPLLLNELNNVQANYNNIKRHDTYTLNPLASIRIFISGGDRLKKEYFDNLLEAGAVYNTYGPTETTVCATYYKCPGGETSNPPIGSPIAGYRVYIMDKGTHHLQPIGIAGELCISGPGVSRGYLNNSELTAEKFLPVFYRSNRTYRTYSSKKIYKTGDLGRWLPDGNIQYLGRVDHQVKIRGFRIEPEEIESLLRKKEGIKETVVMERENKGGDNYLCAYIVPGPVSPGKEADGLDIPGLKEYLSGKLPDYMIPSFFVSIEKLPLTPGGKINRKMLPEPEIKAGETYIAPGNRVEEQLVEIWAEVLGIEKDVIGIESKFFDLGGHSLKAGIMVSKIHKTLDVNLPLAEVFKRKNIRGLAEYIENAGKSKYVGIEPLEEKEYYPLSSAQKRLYFLQQMDAESTAYNMSSILPLGRNIETKKLESTLKKLVARHESLRTSFERVNDAPVQRIYQDVEFKIQYYDLAAGEIGNFHNSKFIIQNSFIHPFDLSRAPLIRSTVIKCEDGNYIWMVDVHHIVSDGTSHAILEEDFLSLYNGDELAPSRLYYKDFACWQNRLFKSGAIKAQEDYWLRLYPGAPPRLHLPADYKRPEIFTFAGEHFEFSLEREDAVKFKELGSRDSATLYMNILAVLDTLFYKYTGQTDIIIGTGTAGRPHADLQQIIGMFINTLAMRNYPEGEKSYQAFLKEVVTHSIQAFENQDVQFEELVDMLDLERDASRNPLFDVMMVVQNFRRVDEVRAGEENKNLPFGDYKNLTSKFDMTFFVYEAGEDIYVNIEYYTEIFKQESIQRLVSHFKNIVHTVIAEPSIKLKDIDIVSDREKQELLYRFNDTETGYPREKTIGALFEEEVGKVPYHTAIVLGEENLTYRALDEQSNRVANYLCCENSVVPGQPVGMLMDRSLSMIVVILGILKAGAAYVPLSPAFPGERIKRMIDDAGIRVLISQKRFIKTLNRLQWECGTLGTFLCIDSEDIHWEDEVEQSELMNRKLWEYVGETSVDEITGGGWNSSYTGNPIPKEEMDEYGDNILKKLEPFLHKNMRVLEIGAASGISMYRIAPRVGFYYGTDLSGAIIEKNRARIKEEGHKNIKFSRLAAHEIHRLDERDFDLVILNSVIQCFNGHQYLRKVLCKAIDLLASKGYIFIGDIMDQELKAGLIADLVKFKQAHRGKNYKTKIDWSEELFISRDYLEDLALDNPDIHDMEFSGKICTIENELTRFRYDALIYIDKTGSRPKKRRERHKKQHDLRMLRKHGTGKVNASPEAGNLAYIIYTSGSTGMPKGTLTTHYNVTRVVKDTDYIEFDPGDRVLQLSDYAFDGSVFDIYGALLNGLPLVMVRREDMLEIEALCGLIVREKITVFFVTTALFNTLVDVGLESLSGIRKVLFGGERVSVNHAAKALEYLGRDRILHVYGPTETTVYATYYPIDAIDENQFTIPIGGPIANTWIYVLNNSLMLVPIGVTGEIYIGGPGVCRGYMNNPELTAEKFLYISERLYKTGDLGRWLPDGTIEFSGRIDHQVKVRGYRIELGEIESRLLNYDSIKECMVTAREDEKGGRYLCAYMVADEEIEAAALKDYLSRGLPDFMIPSYFVQVAGFPLTSTGKTDPSKLPDPRLTLAGDFAPPADEIEEKMVNIWSEVLGIGKEMMGIDSNFFELGGHSLKATILTAKIHKELKVKVPLVEVFNRQTIKELSQYIRHSSLDRYSSLEKTEEKEYYALSAAQKRLYIIQQMELESTRYNMPYMFEVGKEVDAASLENIFRKLIRRHESFRTSFHMVGEVPVQRIHEAEGVDFSSEYVDAGNEMVGKIVKDFSRPFDLSRAPLLKVGFVRLENENNMLLVEMHHIISDGASQGILEREFTALVAGEALPSLRLQYKDYSEWQNSGEQQQIMKEQGKYWLREFSGELPVLNLQADYPRPSIQSYEGRQLSFFINKKITATLKELSRESDATLYMILLSAYNILLSKLSGQEDIIVGTPTAGRRHADLQYIIGMFVNTLSMRNYPVGDKGFSEFLKEVKERTLEAYENQEYQFEDLVDNVSARRDTSRNPIFDVMFNFLNLADYQGDITEADLEMIRDRGECKANFDMLFQGAEVDGAVYFTVDYCTKLYKEETVRRFILYFKEILSEIKADPSRKLSSLELISEEEKRRLLVDFNETAAVYPRDKTIHELFEAQAERTPDGVAVGAQGTVPFNDIYLTYRELNEKSGQLAEVLREKGVLADNIVAIMMERSIEMIIGILGILKVGGAYLPIDPDYPEERKQYMLADSGSRILLTNLSAGHHFHHSSFIIHHSSNLAYVLYTSGTTGRPKGVMVEHRNVVRLVKNTNYVEFKEGDRILPTGALEFDASTFEIWGALLNGLTLYLLEKENILSPETLKTALLSYNITTLWLTSPLFNQLSTADIEIFKGLKNLLVGGDVLSPFHINRVRKRFPRLKVVNGYGPTENTTFSTTYLINKEYNASIPIGKPITNSTAYIVDKYGHLQPPGAAGELVVGGDGVARGYLNQPELTAEKFADYRSYMSYRTNRSYKTGDLARWLPDGNIEFLGRIDHQVKLRGFRVELREIERQLENHPAVKEAVVIVREDKAGDKQLCAYAVYREPIELTGLREFLARTLPDYMIPGFFVTLDKIPLTANGKVDRKSLPEPELEGRSEYIAPRDEVEKRLEEIWKEVLGWGDDTSIGIEDNFFDLGGHSLKATILAAKIYREFQVRITLGQIFQTPTIRGISGFIKKAGRSRFIGVTPVEEKEYYPLSSAQKQFYVMQQLDPNTTTYNVFSLQALEDAVEKEILEDIIGRLIQRHETLRTSFEIVNGEPVQRVHRHVELKIEYYNFAAENITHHFVRPFDLSQAPLLRVGLILLEENKHIFMVDMHHILSDFLSQEILVNEVVALYSGVNLPELKLQYRDYAQWQNRQAISGEIKKQEEYWFGEFSGEIPVLEIPADFPRPRVKSFEGSSINFELDRDAALRLANLARRENATLFMLYLAVVCVLLTKLSGREDIIVGTVVAGRQHPDLENIIGAFINTLTLRNYPGEDKTFRQFLREVRERTLEAFDNQDYRFEDLVQKVMLDRDTSRNPLFDILYSFAARDAGAAADAETSGMADQDNRDLKVEPFGGGEAVDAKFDITIAGAGAGDQCGFLFEYSTRLFKKETIQRYISYFNEIAAVTAKDADIQIKDIIISTDLSVVAADVYDEQSEFEF